MKIGSLVKTPSTRDKLWIVLGQGEIGPYSGDEYSIVYTWVMPLDPEDPTHQRVKDYGEDWGWEESVLKLVCEP